MSEHKGRVVGYVRVSAADQNEARQLEALGDVDRLFSEKVSGKNVDDREKLKEMLAYVREGDKVRGKSPDRWRGPRPVSSHSSSSSSQKASRWSSSTTPR